MQNRRQRGFTIVELLIVIVVIAILAAITITSYTGIQDRAKATQIISMRNAVDKAFKLVAQDKGWTGYPRDNTVVSGVNNPTIAAIAATADFSNYLQASVIPQGITPSYDNDLDTYNGCSIANGGTAIFMQNINTTVGGGTAKLIDEMIDDGNPSCGMVTYRPDYVNGELKLYLSNGYGF